MTNTKKPLEDIVQSLDSKSLTIRFFFITRHLKPSVSKTAKMLEKYSFQLSSVDTDPGLQQMFLQTARQQITNATNDNDLTVSEYEAIDDDTQKVYSYDIKNKAIPFREVVLTEINSNNPNVTDVAGFLEQDGLWAYCVQINGNTDPICLTFTKLYKSRIAVGEGTNPERGAIDRYLRTRFNVQATKLELLEGYTVNFDRRVDCVYSFESQHMYVFHKSNFEKIAALEEEFREVAQMVTARLKEAAIIEGLENVADELDGDTALHRRLHRLAKAIEGQQLDKQRVKNMASTIKEFKLELQIVKDKVQVNTKRDLDEVIRLLEDYYLKSDQTGNKYGASVKKKL